MTYYNEQALLTAEMLVDWKRKRGAYNFETLPAKAIIGLSNEIFRQHLGLFPKRLKGIPGVQYIKGSYICCSNFGSGAPALITLMEELRVLGVQEFIFIGLCASLNSDIISGQSFYVGKAWSENGIAATYVAEKMIVPYSLPYIERIAKQTELDAITCVSTDSPFRETASFMNNAIGEGCRVVEMECASAYAFSQFYQLNVACLLVVADQLQPAWSPPGNMQQLVVVQKKLVDNIIKHRL